MKVARHFSAGKRRSKAMRPLGTLERILIGTFSRPYGNRAALLVGYPALKCRATFKSP